MQRALSGRYNGHMRNRNTLSIIAITFLTTILNSHNVSAAALNACSTLVGKCVNEPSTTRGACFRKYAAYRSCSRSPLHKIVAKRIKYAPQRRKTEKTLRSPNGAKRVEPLCLDYFDIQLRTAIDFGPIDAKRETALMAQLNRCAARIPPTGSMAADPDNTTYSGQSR
jgi:hypothetical protein